MEIPGGWGSNGTENLVGWGDQTGKKNRGGEGSMDIFLEPHNPSGKNIYYINSNEISSELLHENMISLHMKITCYLHM